MPNWAFGDVNITGDADNIEEFLKRFLYDDCETAGRYFARSFATDTHAAIVDQLASEMEIVEDPENMSFSIFVQFAWSAYSCLIDGYPQSDPQNCITLQEACTEHNVRVEIKASEDGMEFAEHYICTPTGMDVEETLPYIQYHCSKCGETRGVSPFEDLEDVICWNCDANGSDAWKKVAK